jgi:dynein light chain roadblock-type
MSEVEETLQRIQTHKNVQGIVIVNADGHIIRSTYQNERK